MPRWGMVLDLRRCIGCNACTIACKQENSTPTEVNFTKTVSEEIGEYPNVTRSYVPLICNHCDDAPCERACPTKATYTREDGIVMVDKNKCIGCKACATACPYKNRFMLYKKYMKHGYYGNGSRTPFEEQGYTRWVPGTAVKCTLCHDRVDNGLEPACVATCPTEARVFGDLDDPSSKPRQLIQARKGYQPHQEFNTQPKVFYID